MSNKDKIKKVQKSPFLPHKAKDKYVFEREKYLKEKDKKEEASLNKTLDSLNPNFIYSLKFI